MECDKIIELLSPYLDGQLETYELQLVDEHLKHCPKCREEWRALQEISSLMQTLPEITPPPEFHAALKSRLSTLPVPTAVDTVKQKENLLQRLTGGRWLKAAAFAAVVMLASGITYLWCSDEPGVKTGPAQEQQEASTQKPPTRQPVLNTGTEESRKSSPSKFEPQKQEVAVKQNDARRVTRSNNSPNKYGEEKAADGQRTKVSKTEVAMRPEKVTKGANPGSSGLLPAGVPQDIAPPDQAGSFGVKSFSKTDNEQNDQSPPQVSLLEQSEQKVIQVQLKVDDLNNAKAELLILCQNSAAKALIQENKITINVPVQNYDRLIKDIQSLGQATIKEPLIKDESLEGSKSSREQFYTILLELQQESRISD